MRLNDIGLELLVIQIQFLKYIFYECFGIIRIINRKFIIIWRIIADFTSEESCAEGMKCIHPDFVSRRPHKSMNTFPHFLGSLVCESDCQNFRRTDSRFHHVGNPAGQ